MEFWADNAKIRKTKNQHANKSTLGSTTSYTFIPPDEEPKTTKIHKTFITSNFN